MANLVTNGTFESNITGWNGVSVSRTRDTTDFHTGVGCMRVQGTASSNPRAYSTTITVVAGTTYRFKAWVKGGSGTFALAFATGALTELASASFAAVPGAWTEVYFDYTPAVTGVSLWFKVGTTGDVLYVDDVELDVAPAPPASSPGSVIRGGVKKVVATDSVIRGVVKKVGIPSVIRGGVKKTVV